MTKGGLAGRLSLYFQGFGSVENLCLAKGQIMGGKRTTFGCQRSNRNVRHDLFLWKTKAKIDKRRPDGPPLVVYGGIGPMEKSCLTKG